MYGKSWGGFNGLQVAFRQPPALAAIISLYSTGRTQYFPFFVLTLSLVKTTGLKTTFTGRVGVY